VHERQFAGTAGRLSPGLLDRPRRLKAERLTELSGRLDRAAARAPLMAEQGARLPQLGRRMAEAVARRRQREGERLQRLGQLLVSLNPDRPLELGFARVHLEDGTLIRRGADLQEGDAVRLRFADQTRAAVVAETDDAAAPARPRPARPGRAKPPSPQGNLF